MTIVNKSADINHCGANPDTRASPYIHQLTISQIISICFLYDHHHNLNNIPRLYLPREKNFRHIVPSHLSLFNN